MTLSTSAVAVCCCSEFAQFAEQPRVLDGNHRLISEGGEELNLPLGEWPHRTAAESNHPDGLSLAQHRRGQ